MVDAAAMLKKRSKSKNNLNMSKESLQGVSLDSVSTAAAAAANESPVDSREVLYRNPAYRNRYSVTIVEHVSPP